MRSFLITLILLFGFVTSTNCDENKENLKMVTKDFTMHFINLFKGLRPAEENASSVAITSTDHLPKDLDINKLLLKS